MGGKALLIGCNYPGSKAELAGCVNDVWDFKQTLTECMGFEEDNITIMVDTDEEYTQPTGRNIKAHLRSMVEGAEDGDVLFVHFSGHGTQIPTDDPDEEDAKDECICPCDMNVISDDDLTEIFAPLSEKDVKLTFVADCCHSGTLLDHEEVIITGPKDDSREPPQANAEYMQSMLAELGADPDSREVKTRALPYEDFTEILSEKMGEEENMGNVRANMIRMFGEDFGSSRYATLVQLMLLIRESGGDIHPILEALKELAKAPKRGIDENVGILVSGCLARECAADARPPEAEPHGAFSHTVNKLLRQLHEEEALPVSNRELILGVRDSLSKAGFAQSPCLECSEKWADAAFVVRDEE